MADSDEERKLTTSAEGLRDTDMDTNGIHNGASSGTSTVGSAELRARRHRTANGLSTPSTPLKGSASHSPIKQQSNPQSPAVKSEDEDIVGGGITVKLEPGQAPKLSRATSKKVERRPARLFINEQDATQEAISTYDTIHACTYGNKNLGATEHGMECDCHEEWDAANLRNDACGEDSDCINRATKMECVGDCACGPGCQNRRFQQKVYADVSVFKTEHKGFGLRTNVNLKPHEFIFEYIGEVIGENIFYKRLRQYDQEGMKHFYFMSLNKGEFVDASKKGNLGRFCNHSCNPNCYVDKWVVGDKLRMGIFADRNIAAGEEIVFNYNVDRYGADPQRCFCGEPNCTGFIGGKNQTERATKLSALTIEALGIEDAEAWDSATASARKPRKKKTEEADEEYVDSVQPKSLDENGVTKVMATLMQCKEKWIVVKLLGRIHRCDEPAVRNRVIRMHGYRILNSTLATWIEDDSICLQILDILHQFPRVTRNKIEDAKISKTVEQLRERRDEQVKSKAIDLLEAWSKLEMGYRIPRRDAAAIAAQEKVYEQDERRRTARGRSPSRSRSKSSSPERMKGLPTGPRASMPQRNANFFTARPPFRRPPVPTLPLGWYSAQAENGKTYFYNSSGGRTWDRPTTPAPQPPPPPKQATNEQKLQDIINEITKTTTNRESGSASATPKTAPHSPKPSQKPEKWRSWNEEKRKRVYENTLFPYIKHVMDKYRGKLPKEDLKRFAKDVAKTLVNSDFKNERVDDPTKVSSKQERQVKKYVKEYFDKAVDKRKAYDRKKAEKKAREEGSSKSMPESTTPLDTPPGHPSRAAVEDEVVLSDMDDDDDETSEQITDDASDLKRKRDANETPLTGESPEASEAPTPTKRVRPGTPPPPTPPPPPPEPADDQLRSPLDYEMSEAPMKEAGLTPGEDVRGTFHDEALEAVAVAGAVGGQESPMDLSSPFEGQAANNE